MTTTIIENELLKKLTHRFDRSPLQLNKLLESDAELVRIPAGVLAVTTDTIAEEIATGLYHDPYLAGWMAVTASLSDLAAVGAEPIGLVVSEMLPAYFPGASLERLQEGIHEACNHHHTHILGGDTNMADHLALTTCALGIAERPLSRLGCRPGDGLYCSGPLGAGNAFALCRYMREPGFLYRPAARLREGRALAGVASACMDTSDGALATLDQLMRLNGCGFELEASWQSALDPVSRAVIAGVGSEWLLLAGEHGEFELIFTVPAEREPLLRTLAGWKPIRLGRAIPAEEIRLAGPEGFVAIDTGRLRNLLTECRGDTRRYISALIDYDRELRERREPSCHPEKTTLAARTLTSATSCSMVAASICGAGYQSSKTSSDASRRTGNSSAAGA